MSKNSQGRKTGLDAEKGMLDDLNVIVDFVVGNQKSEAVDINSETLAEALAFLEIYPKNWEAQAAAMRQLRVLDKMVKDLIEKVRILQKRQELRIKK